MSLPSSSLAASFPWLLNESLLTINTDVTEMASSKPIIFPSEKWTGYYEMSRVGTNDLMTYVITIAAN